MPELLYLIGFPGAGKTTLLSKCLEGIPSTTVLDPFAHVVYPGGAQLGKVRGTFSGTDALSLSVQPKVVKWLSHRPYENIVAEGDRLANERFFQSVQEYGYHLTVVYLDIPPWTAAERRAERGSNQNPAWVRGRQTKVAGLASRYVRPVWWLDGCLPAKKLAETLCQHPVIRGLAAKS